MDEHRRLQTNPAPGARPKNPAWDGKTEIVISLTMNGGFIVETPECSAKYPTLASRRLAACTDLEALRHFMFPGQYRPNALPLVGNIPAGDPPPPFPPRPGTAFGDAFARATHGAGQFPPFPKHNEDDGA